MLLGLSSRISAPRDDVDTVRQLNTSCGRTVVSWFRGNPRTNQEVKMPSLFLATAGCEDVSLDRNRVLLSAIFDGGPQPFGGDINGRRQRLAQFQGIHGLVAEKLRGFIWLDLEDLKR